MVSFLPCFISELCWQGVAGLGPGLGGRDHVGGHHPPHLHRPLLPGPRHPPGRGEVAPLDDVEGLHLGDGEVRPLLDVLGQALTPLHGDEVLGLDVADGEERLDLDLKQRLILISSDSPSVSPSLCCCCPAPPESPHQCWTPGRRSPGACT